MMPVEMPDDWARERVLTLLAKLTHRDPMTISPDEKLQDLLLDSLDLVELLMTFEDQFGIDSPDEECGSWRTVQDLIDWVRRRGRP